MIARLLAALAAVALVAGALAYRSSRDDGDGRGDDATSSSATVVCVTELAPLCEAAGLEATIEPAGVTADRLAAVPDGADPGLGAWVTIDPWPAIVDDRRQLGNRRPLGEGEAVGRTPVALAVFRDRYDVLLKACGGGDLTWKCFGEQAPKPWSAIGGPAGWGPVKVTHADAAREATGLVAIGALTAGYFGRSDLALIDVQEDDGFRDWFQGIERAVPAFTTSAVDDMLVRGPAAFDAAVVLEALADPVIDASPRAKPELIYPAPMSSVVLHVVRFGRGGDRAVDAIAELRDDFGWQAPTAAPTGLPRAGLLDALRTVWQEVAA